jgi:hypothetical protein
MKRSSSAVIPPIYPANNYNLGMRTRHCPVLEAFTGMKAYMNSQNHHGNDGVKEGIHHVRLKGMVDAKTISYAVIKLTWMPLLLSAMAGK